MADTSTINDYSLIDNFLQESLNSYTKQVFGNYDDKTGYFPTQKNEIEEDLEQSQELEDEQNYGYATDPVNGTGQTEEEAYYDSLFGDGTYQQSTQQSDSDFFDTTPDAEDDSQGFIQPGYSNQPSSTSSAPSGFRSFGSYEEGKKALLNQLELYKTGRTKNPVKPTSTLLEAMSVYAPASDNNNPKRYAQFIADKLGITINTPINKIDTNAWAEAIEKMEGNKKGNNPGNLRPSKQYGGVPIAKTKNQQYIGLNDDTINSLILPLQGSNTIRGLDSGEPVFVEDETGKQEILRGPKHLTRMKGKVFERKL